MYKQVYINLLLLLLTGDIAALGSCCLDFPLVMDSILEIWAK